MNITKIYCLDLKGGERELIHNHKKLCINFSLTVVAHKTKRMKKVFAPILTGLVLGAVGFFIGQNIGYENGRQSAEMMQNLRSIDEIKTELKEREEEDISSYIEGKAGIRNVDEGSLFKVKYIQYFSGNLTNSATLASAKDIKLNVDFYSKTGSKIGNQEITIYEFIRPGGSVEFNEKINVPEKVEDFKFQIMEAKSE